MSGSSNLNAWLKMKTEEHAGPTNEVSEFECIDGSVMTSPEVES